MAMDSLADKLDKVDSEVQKQEAAAAGADPNADKPKPEQKFLQPGTERDRFKEFIKTRYKDDGGPEQIDHWENHPDQLDVSKFADYAKEYQEARDSVDSLTQYLTEERLAKMKAMNPEFAKYVTLIGEKKMSQLWKDKLPDLMVKNPDRFEDIKNAIVQWDKQRDERAKVIRQSANQLGIKTPEEYARIMAMSDAKKRKQALIPHVRNNFDRLKSADKKGWFFKERESRVEKTADSMQTKGRDEYVAELGKINQKLQDLCTPMVELLEAIDTDATTGTSTVGVMRGAYLDAIKHTP